MLPSSFDDNRALIAAESAYLDPPEASCPECGAAMEADSEARTVSCTRCPYQDAYDWDARG